jgi:hypothetical protein
MQAPTRNSLAVVAAGMAAGLVGWAVVRLLGVELTVESGSGTAQVDVVDELVATLVAGLAAWGVFALLLRRRRARWWPFIGSTALAISMNGPSYLADGSSAVALVCMHVVVGVVLITGFMRAVPNPYWIADAAAGQPWYRG